MTNGSPQKDIITLPENTKGRDILVGDVHGTADLLIQLINTLNNYDRLFIVGDLADRGPGSLKVVQTIIRFNQMRKAKGLPEIQAVCGNHEKLFLNYYEGKSQHLLSQNVGGSWVKNCSAAEMQQVADYYASLPYIIYVEGRDPFNVVHADMPFSDQELQRRFLTQNYKLSDIEKYHATWAREGEKQHLCGLGRTQDSIITYCGHTIGEGVRVQSNHINLDVGAYFINNLCVMEHQTKQCYLLGAVDKRTLDLGFHKSAHKITKEIEQHFKTQPDNSVTVADNKPLIGVNDEVIYGRHRIFVVSAEKKECDEPQSPASTNS